MAIAVCPTCKVEVNSRGLAGHLRFAHKLKSGKTLRETLDAGLANKREETHDPTYEDIDNGLKKMSMITERAREIKWLFYHKKLFTTEGELTKLLGVLKQEYVKASQGVFWRREVQPHIDAERRKKGKVLVLETLVDTNGEDNANNKKLVKEKGDYKPVAEAKEASEWKTFEYTEEDKKEFEDDDNARERKDGIFGIVYKESAFNKEMKKKYG